MFARFVHLLCFKLVLIILCAICVGARADDTIPSFFISTNTITSFSFSISAAGNFTVDWGDGEMTGLSRTNTSVETVSHTYQSAGEYTIGIGGRATGYSTNATTAAISFSGNTTIVGISGSLGAIFPTLASGGQPRFNSLFSNCTNLGGNIPSTLFDGVVGAPVSNMFRSSFFNCPNLSGSIPADLFAGLNGPPADGVFYSTFNQCSGLSGNIPGELFAGLYGAPASNMFYQTFYGCSNLSGTIPNTLFFGVVGSPADNMFRGTFYGCSGLTGKIPGDLFAGISGSPQNYSFYMTFQNCSGLSGWVPWKLFANITTGASATYYMHHVFYNSGLDTSCPDDYAEYNTGFESNFDGAVSCKRTVECDSGYAAYDDECYKKCSFADSLRVGDDDTQFTLFGEESLSGNPMLHVYKDGTECYIFTGVGYNRLNIKTPYRTVYHAVDAD